MDKRIICLKCNKYFIWSTGEQTFFQKKNFSEPKNCKPCRTREKKGEKTFNISSHGIDNEALAWGKNLLNRKRTSKQKGSASPVSSTETQYIRDNRLSKEALADGQRDKEEAIKDAQESWGTTLMILAGIIVSYLIFSPRIEILNLAFFIYGFAILLLLIFLFASIPPGKDEVWINHIKKAGADGEDLVLEKLIELQGKYILFNQLEIPSQKSSWDTTETDLIILNKHGVFILEVKHNKGKIIGSESDTILRLDKESNRGYIYENELKNPIKQLNWQVYALKSYLEKQGITVWIEGYVIFSNNNCTLDIQNRKKLIHLQSLDLSIFNKGKVLSDQKVRQIEKILSQL